MQLCKVMWWQKYFHFMFKKKYVFVIFIGTYVSRYSKSLHRMQVCSKKKFTLCKVLYYSIKGPKNLPHLCKNFFLFSALFRTVQDPSGILKNRASSKPTLCQTALFKDLPPECHVLLYAKLPTWKIAKMISDFKYFEINGISIQYIFKNKLQNM